MISAQCFGLLGDYLSIGGSTDSAGDLHQRPPQVFRLFIEKW